jgi:hypothetical protein
VRSLVTGLVIASRSLVAAGSSLIPTGEVISSVSWRVLPPKM